MDRMLAATVEIDVPAGPDAEGARRATEVAGPASTSRVRPPDPEVLRQRAATTRNAAHGGVDQSADTHGRPGCPRNHDRHPGRPAASGDLPATTHQ